MLLVYLCFGGAKQEGMRDGLVEGSGWLGGAGKCDAAWCLQCGMGDGLVEGSGWLGDAGKCDAAWCLQCGR